MKISQSMGASGLNYDPGIHRESQSSEKKSGPSLLGKHAVTTPSTRKRSREEVNESNLRDLQRLPPSLMRQALMKGADGTEAALAKKHGQAADEKQRKFRALRERSTSQGAEMLKYMADIVTERNRELASLGGLTATADVSSPPNKSYFWSGNTFKNGEMIHSAMTTAQSIARKNEGVTLEMTEGGHQLDNYGGESNSFSYLQERFQYAKPTSASPPGYAPHKEMVEKGVAQVGVDMLKETGLDKTNTSTYIPNDTVPAANILWDNLSMRYANKVSGETVAVHAMSKDDPYNQNPTYLANTWNTKERPILDRNNINVKEIYSENLKDELVGPSSGHPTNWEATGGYRGNLT
ncbi:MULTISPECIES: hypothetical protein [Pseudomonas syringae group]|uniref:hypothetical protein n=1 Tax=Pseudomonas syringae group TaxID=136849 RepID=UPI000F3E5FD6|nr:MULTISPECIES: hypothetical protein [Pseudomonas syringae group]MCF5712756.1 hypothetical protein [Pseudomonas tremae]MCF5746827.1 hypothetical protein [Pseudomonas tremae]RMP33366.1 hypothetical protein ALQ25_200044 [Pseudomonas coronafaciens pv. atropurpurea]UQB31700.1 hypothetical protein I9H06_26230 [Pseudomonas tremae]UQB39533.1 hypothetical protein I9H09_25975 [Pseudomonas tremae]